nr:hypothetical protein [uncultured Flavobacterium sp.]
MNTYSTIESIEELFNNGKWQECNESVKIFLLLNPDNLGALLLEAKCLYELADLIEDDTYVETMEKVLAKFEHIATLETQNKDALLYAAYIIIYIRKTNLHQAVVYCNTMLQIQDFYLQQKALEYKIETNVFLENIDETLADIDVLIQYYKEKFENNKLLLDEHLGTLYERKTYIYLDIKNDIPQAFAASKIKFEHMSEGSLIDIRIAKLAFEQQDYQLGILAYESANECLNPPSDEAFIEVYNLALDLQNKGYHNEKLFDSIITTIYHVGESYFGEDIDTLLFDFAQQFIEKEPKWFFPYHIIGRIYYESRRYEEAIPYFIKALQYGGFPKTVYRYVESCFYTTGQVPEIKSLPEGLPQDYYSIGVEFNDFEEECLNDSDNKKKILEIKTQCYENAFNSFYNYFYNNTGSSRYNQRHTFAMCCNNYGIALQKLGKYEEAIKIHEIGYDLSPFVEQLQSWGRALRVLNRNQEALEKYLMACAYPSQYLDFNEYLYLSGEIIDIYYKQGEEEKGATTFKKVDAEYENYLELYKNDLTDQELYELRKWYVGIQNGRNFFIKNKPQEEQIAIWQEQLEKDPDNFSAWLMIAGNYYVTKDYQNCIACINHYFILRGDDIEPRTKMGLLFKRGVAFVNTEQYKKGVVDLEQVLNLHDTEYQTTSADISEIYEVLTQGYHALQQWEDCRKYAQKSLDLNNENDWIRDEPFVETLILGSDACKALGYNSQALEWVNYILEFNPDNIAAQQRKKDWSSKGLFSFFKK